MTSKEIRKMGYNTRQIKNRCLNYIRNFDETAKYDEIFVESISTTDYGTQVEFTYAGNNYAA